MHYYEGDAPGAVSVVPASVEDLTGLDTATASLTSPAGTSEALTATFDGTLVTVTLPTLASVGTYTLRVALSGVSRAINLEPARIPVESLTGDGWHTIDSARREWPGATSDDARLLELLDVSRIQVLEYAPELEDGATVPVNYKAAQLMQARNVWNAYQTDPNSNVYGPDGFSVPVYPLDWSVKQMLRPKRAVPVVA